MNQPIFQFSDSGRYNLCSDDSQCTPSGEHKVGKCEIVPGQAYGTCISVCDTANHWVGTDTFACDETNKYILSGDSCSLVECTSTDHCTSRLPANATEWSCNTTQYQCEIAGCDNGFSVSDDKLSCVCAAGSIVVNNECVTKKTCNTGEVLDETTNTCACDTAHGYIVFEEACVAKAICRTGEVYNDATNACDCDTDNNYIAYGGACIPKATCGEHEVYVEATNTCVCDAEHLWTGMAGTCSCSGFLNASGECVAKTTCEKGEIYVAESNECRLLQPGDIITFGHYEQDNDTTNGKEPITRLLLYRTTGQTPEQYLVISEKALDTKPYGTISSNMWEDSTLRQWLNDDFIDAAFSPDEKNQIIVPSNSPLSDAPKDKFFAFSSAEALQIFGAPEPRQAVATQYAIANGASTATVGGVQNLCSWWLRDKNGFRYTASVNSEGNVDLETNVTAIDIAVRPVLWMNF